MKNERPSPAAGTLIFDLCRLSFRFDFPETEVQEHLLTSSAVIAADRIGIGNAVDNIAHHLKAFDAVIYKRMCCNFHIHLFLIAKL